MRLILFFALIHVAYLSVPEDWIDCMEKGECGIFPVCSFKLVGCNKNCSLDGFVFKIKNGVDYDIEFYWDVLGVSSEDHELNVPPHSFRYIDSRASKTHTVRLFMEQGNDSSPEPVDTAVGFPGNKCSQEESCDYLMRLCYYSRREDPEISDTCDAYDKFCQASENSHSEMACVESCLTSRTSSMLEEISGKKNKKLQMNALIECLAGEFSIQNTTTPVACPVCVDTTPLVSWLIVTSILTVIFAVGLAWAIWTICTKDGVAGDSGRITSFFNNFNYAPAPKTKSPRGLVV